MLKHTLATRLCDKHVALFNSVLDSNHIRNHHQSSCYVIFCALFFINN